jgi:hypothetical protein
MYKTKLLLLSGFKAAVTGAEDSKGQDKMQV